MQQEDLILAARSGDVVAMNRLLVACQTDARRYARRHCAVSDIDDAVQESLLILSRKIGGLKAAAAFSGWLFTVVRRECQRLSRRMFGQGQG
jgi:DNA-directed RNA polymerase specialized sigma24 family protein